MPDLSIASRGRSARLLICGFGPFPGFPDNPAATLVRRLQAEGWSPDDLGAAYRELPTTWTGAAETAAAALRETGADGILMLGVAAGAEGFRVEMRAQNKARTDLADAVGFRFPRSRISVLGPAVARASAPVEPMVAALHGEGLPARASSDAGDYLCNYTFYRILTEVAVREDAPRAAFLHLPPVRQNEAGPGLPLADLERGVKAAASAFARTLAFGPRVEPVTA